MLGLTIAAIVTVAAGYLIVKRAYAPAVLLVAGVVLLAIAALGDIGLGLGLKKSSGSIFFDIFLVVENVMSTLSRNSVFPSCAWQASRNTWTACMRAAPFMTLWAVP